MNPRKMTEPQLRAAVLARCAGRDLWVPSVEPARFNQRSGDNQGFPDLQVIGPGGVIYRELKTVAGNGVGRGLSPAQSTWKNRLLASGQDWDIWTPADLASGRVDRELDEIEQPDEYSDLMALALARDIDYSK